MSGKGSNSHKPGCKCVFCQKKRAKELKMAAATASAETIAQKPTEPVAIPDNQPPATEPLPAMPTKQTGPWRSLFINLFGSKTSKAKLKEEERAVVKAIAARREAKKKEALSAAPKVPQQNIVTSGTWLLVTGITSLVLGAGAAWFWLVFASTNSMMALMTILLCAAGVVLIWLWFQKKDTQGHKEVIVLSSGEKPAPKGTANSLTIYPDRVVFENVPNPQGQPWKCKNDGKFYFVHIESTAFTNAKLGDSSSWKLKPFQLPDSKYYDPSLFATRVLELPAHRRIFRRKETLLEKLSPLMALGGIAIFAIIMVVTL